MSERPNEHETRLALAPRLAELADAVEQHLRTVVDSAPLPDDLAGMLRYHLGWVDEQFRPADVPRGKQVRPALCLLACEAAGGDWRGALGSAAAVELIHNFSLVHDDIEDDSPLRRHRPTLWALWGVPRALNAGDTLLILAQLAVLGDEGSGAEHLAAARLLNQACRALCVGQHRDLTLGTGTEPSLADYLAMIDGKTAALLRTAAELGALAAGAAPEAQAGFGRFGAAVGLAFQLQDDLLDVWGDPAAMGKPAREDLRARKRSLPFVLACERAAPAMRARLRRLYAQDEPLDDGRVDELVGLLAALGVREEAERLVRHHHETGLAALRAAQPDAKPRAPLKALAASLLGRQA